MKTQKSIENHYLSWLSTPINQTVALSGMTLCTLVGIFHPSFNPREIQDNSQEYAEENHGKIQTKYLPSRKYRSIKQP